MKKTLLAFSVTITLSIALFLGVSLTGCEWFNTNVLGKQSQIELDQLKLKADQELARLDSTRKAELAKVAELQARETTETNNKIYHIIVGSYEDPSNTNKMCETLRAKGYTPVTFKMGEFTCVSAKSYDSLAEAERQLEVFLDYDFCPDDVWVYKKN